MVNIPMGSLQSTCEGLKQTSLMLSASLVWSDTKGNFAAE